MRQPIRSGRHWARTLAAAACCAGVSATAAPAHPIHGGRYRGTTTKATSIAFRVAHDGRRLLRYDFEAKTRCNDGESGTVVLRTARNTPIIRIRAGRFSVFVRAHATIVDRNQRQLPGTYIDAVRGRFGSHRDATGTVRIRFRSRDGMLRCDSGKLRYSARAS
jgi:hypothetical protein